jgi:large conductance mechanosensitive channel
LYRPRTIDVWQWLGGGRHRDRSQLSAKVQAGVSYADAKKQGAVLGWGQFLSVALNFLIIAWVLFLAIRGINKLKKEEPATPPGPTTEEKLLTEIRDLLKR